MPTAIVKLYGLVADESIWATGRTDGIHTASIPPIGQEFPMRLLFGVIVASLLAASAYGQVPTGLSSSNSPLTLAEAEAMAVASHPAIAEAESRVRAARANCLQVGLPPNPTAGYLASEIGNEGHAGQQGIYVGQKFIRGNKLELNRQIACQQVREQQQQLAAEQLRVLTAVRVAFFEVYLAQRKIELAEQLVAVSQKATESVEQLLAVKEARRIDVLQAEIERERIGVKLRQAIVSRDAAWRQFTTAINHPEFPLQVIDADPASLRWHHDWDSSRQMLIEGSPQIAALVVEISRARAALARACAEPISDVSAQVSVQYDDSTEYTVTGVQVGMPIPLWNRNQGGIGKARHELAAAKHRLENIELQLLSRLAEHLQQLDIAQAQADAYQNNILQRAQQNLDLTQQAYDAGEVTYLELLTVQRTYFESKLDYLDALRQVSQSIQLLTGFMLDRNSE